jgi:hypothetical protein
MDQIGGLEVRPAAVPVENPARDAAKPIGTERQKPILRRCLTARRAAPQVVQIKID